LILIIIGLGWQRDLDNGATVLALGKAQRPDEVIEEMQNRCPRVWGQRRCFGFRLGSEFHFELGAEAVFLDAGAELA
jgi:hypothetical protein